MASTERKRRSQRGNAAIELSIMLPLITMMLFAVIEGGNALRTYNILHEATREGARHMLNHNDPVAAQSLTKKIVESLPYQPSWYYFNVDNVKKTVKVKVEYEYHSFFLDDAYLQALNSGPLLLSAQTTMPLP